MNNALKYTLKGSIDISVTFQNNFLFTKVQDTGVGIKRNELDNLFKPLAKMINKNILNQGGLKLGLLLSRTLCEKLGGDIEVNS